VACAKMADKNIVCIVCSVCVHPVLPCSHSTSNTEIDLICNKCFQALPTTDKPKHLAQETKLKDSPIPADKPVKTPDLESVKEDIKVKDDLHVAEYRADLNLLELENDKEQNVMLTGKKPEQENDETMPVDDNKAGGKKKKRKHCSRRGKGAAASRWSPRNKQKTEGTTGLEDTDDLKGVAKELFTSPGRKKTTSPENVSTENRKKVDLDEGSRDLEESNPRKKAKVDDPFLGLTLLHHLSKRNLVT
jgi:hypothetical protein